LSISTAIALSAAQQASASPFEPDSTQLVGAAQMLSRGPAATMLSPRGLIGEQIAFNVAFATDFLSTGADLFAREFAIPRTLASELAGGTPPPVAVGHAVQTFAAVEVDAGVALVRFGHEYVRFQRQFVRGIVTGESATASTVVRAPASTTLTNRSGLRDQAARPVTVVPVRASGQNDFHVLRHLADRERRGEGLGRHRR
jgi:hypothetical protein